MYAPSRSAAATVTGRRRAAIFAANVWKIELAQSLGLDKDEIAVVGDNENDLSMFRVIPASYCIDHAAPAIQAAASRSVASVAQALALAREIKG